MEIKYLIGGAVLFVLSIIIFIYAMRVQEKKVAFLTIPFTIVLAWYLFASIVRPEIKSIWLDRTLIKCILAIIWSIYMVGYAVKVKKIYGFFTGVFGILLLFGISWYLSIYLVF